MCPSSLGVKLAIVDNYSCISTTIKAVVFDVVNLRQGSDSTECAVVTHLPTAHPIKLNTAPERDEI
jgi:hypothetical protein